MQRCLAKDPAKRLRDAGDIGIELNDSETSWAKVAPVDQRPRAQGWRRYLRVTGILVVGGVIGAAAWDRARQVKHDMPASRLVVPIGPEFDFSFPIAISPDGTKLAFVESREGSRTIVLRDLNSFDSKPLTATELGGIFFSPDSRWLGFQQDGFIRKISLSTGAIVRLARTEAAMLRLRRRMGRRWHSLLFGPGPLVRRLGPAATEAELVPGPQSESMTALQWWPEALPGGEWLLLTGYVSNTNEPGIVVRSLRTGETRMLVESGMAGRYVQGGYLVYARAGKLFAVRFDAERARILGSPVSVVDGVFTGCGSSVRRSPSRGPARSPTYRALRELSFHSSHGSIGQDVKPHCQRPREATAP